MRFSFKQDGISRNEYISLAEPLSEYVSRLSSIAGSGQYFEPESSLCLPGDGSVLSEVSEICRDKIKAPLKCVAVAGIGGSNLGAKAVYDAILGWRDQIEDGIRPKMIFFDTVDEKNTLANTELILKKVQKPEELLLVIISESGGTIETMAQAEHLLAELGRRFPGLEERVVVVTNEGSPLYAEAKMKGLTVISTHERVSGRYSVFSAAGLLPLMAAGLDVRSLVSGALSMRALCLSLEYDNNPALESAVFISHWYKAGKNIHDSFYFCPELESLGKWHRQLLGESIGKSEHTGITPTVSIGSTDMHSVGQLYVGGPKDKTTLFVSVVPESGAGVPRDVFFQNVSRLISGRTFGEIMNAIFGGVKLDYQKRGLPFLEVEFSKLSETELGAFMMWKMVETMYLGRILKVDAFDQPAVEAYKKETAAILEETGKSSLPD